MASKIVRLSVVFLLMATIAFAEEKIEQKEEISSKEATGTISGLGSNFIAIETGLDTESKAARESAFNLDKNVRVVHKKSLKELNIGDTVKIDYQEKVKTRDDGRKLRSTLVKMITFLKPAPKELVAQEEKAITITPKESEPQEGSLPLKGLKGR